MGRDEKQEESRGGILSRRELLGLMGTAGVGALTGLDPAEARAVLPSSLACVARPAQTEGPYFVDETLQRADLRVDPTDGSVRPGAELLLRIVASRIGGGGCVPLNGARVDVWQCDAMGVYSDVLDRQGRFDTRGKKFLRGFQRTLWDGGAEFVTVYPGWYEGRAPHIHFKVRPLGDDGRPTHEFTSQLYFDDALTDRVYRGAPYNARPEDRVRNEEDGIFRGGGTGAQLVLEVEEREGDEGPFFAATFEVGLLIP